MCLFPFQRKRRLPNVPIFVLTGEVPENYGGVTTVALGRCNVFAEMDDREITLLTVSPIHAMSIDALRSDLVADGRLDSRVNLRNPWSDILQLEDQELNRLGSSASVEGHVEFPEFSGEFEVRASSRSEGFARVYRYRPDGSPAISDTREIDSEGNPSRRLITAFSRRGNAVGQWSSPAELYRRWLGFLTEAQEMSIVIAERLTTSNLFVNWSAENVVFVQAVHSHHHSAGALQAFRYPAPKAKFYRSLDKREMVATLTGQQAEDLRETNLSGVDNLATLPNWLTEEPLKSPTQRDRLAGVIVSRISQEKQIDHSLKALNMLSPAYKGASVDIFGDGDSLPALEELASELGLSEQVAFQGYVSRGGRKFRDYSFSLHTGKTEGQLLVVLESMAAGCIPIAYNIKYGPSDSITHGVDGFLVEPNDIEGLAKQIELFGSMSETEVLRMRKAAIRRSRDFLPGKISRRWAEELHGAIERKKRKSKVVLPDGYAKLGALRVDEHGVVLRLRVSKDLVAHDWSWAKISWVQRKTGIYGRTSAQLKREPGKLVIRGRIDFEQLEHAHSRSDAPLGLWVDLGDSDQMQRVRIIASPNEEVSRYGPYRLAAASSGNLLFQFRQKVETHESENVSNR